MVDRQLWSARQLSLVVAGVGFAIFLLTYTLVSWYFPSRLSSVSDDPAYVWLSMVFATSSPSWDWFRTHFNALGFSVSLTAHILLNVSAFLGMIWFATDAALKKGKLMNLANAVGLRDSLIKSFILEAVLPKISSDEKAKVVESFNSAVDRASEEWERLITDTMGEKAAKEVASLMRHPV